MKMHYSVPLALVFLLSCQAGNALKCYTCAGDCKGMDPSTCITGMDSCMSISVKNDKETHHVKSCIPKALCDVNYANLPPSFQSAKPTCCSSDLCNSAATNMISLISAALLAILSVYLSQF